MTLSGLDQFFIVAFTLTGGLWGFILGVTYDKEVRGFFRRVQEWMRK